MILGGVSRGELLLLKLEFVLGLFCCLVGGW